MNPLYSMIVSFAGVIGLVVVAFIGVYAINLRGLFGVVIPYAAILTFFAGVVYRVLTWARSPVPFRIPTTAGQQKSLPWIKDAKIDNPSTTAGVVVRMLFEILTFRSLFRNTRMEMHDGPRLAYGSEKWLWLAAIAFHYSFLVIFIRHFRLFVEPTPFFIPWIEQLDAWFEVGIPELYITNLVILGALGWLFVRRVIYPQIRYISLPSDYFPLFLILGIAATGILMRYFIRVDVALTKEFIVGLFTFSPKAATGIGSIFFIHLFLVSVLIAYFPFSKLTHMAGVFLSPTRNLANNNRFKRHVNPWNYPVKVHTYEEYENEFRDRMIEAGLPVEKES